MVVVAAQGVADVLFAGGVVHAFALADGDLWSRVVETHRIIHVTQRPSSKVCPRNRALICIVVMLPCNCLRKIRRSTVFAGNLAAFGSSLVFEYLIDVSKAYSSLAVVRELCTLVGVVWRVWEVNRVFAIPASGGL